MDEGFLAEPRCFSHPVKPDLGKVKTTAGEYDQAELGAAMDKRELVGNIVEHWARLAEQRRTVVFATNVAHSRNIVDAFRANSKLSISARVENGCVYDAVARTPRHRDKRLVTAGEANLLSRYWSPGWMPMIFPSGVRANAHTTVLF